MKNKEEVIVSQADLSAEEAHLMEEQNDGEK